DDRVVAAQAQPETAPTARDAVAGTLVTAADTEGGNDLLAEADRLWFAEVRDDDRHAGLASPRLDDQHGAAVLSGLRGPTAANRHDIGDFSTQGTEWGEVALDAVAVVAGDDELLHGPRAGQANACRPHRERNRLANDGGLLRFAGRHRGGREHQDQTKAEGQASPRAAAGLPVKPLRPV